MHKKRQQLHTAPTHLMVSRLGVLYASVLSLDVTNLLLELVIAHLSGASRWCRLLWMLDCIKAARSSVQR